MVAAPLVDDRVEAGRALIRTLDESGVEVVAAFWEFSEARGDWRLFIATPLIDSVGGLEAYRQVLSHLDVQGDTFWQEVSLISPKDPLVRTMGKLVRTAPKPALSKIRLTGSVIDRQIIDDALVYRTT
jgi:hypothetical protein